MELRECAKERITKRHRRRRTRPHHHVAEPTGLSNSRCVADAFTMGET